jgi:hypothetical protein
MDNQTNKKKTMKQRLIINEQEKKEILEKHNLFKQALQTKRNKPMVNEQASSGGGRNFLIAARDKGCKIAKGGVIQSAPGKPTVLYKKADYDSPNGYFKIGDELYIKDDFTFDVVTTDASGKKTLTFSNRTWKCSALTDPIEQQVKTNIQRTEQEGDWKKREDITDTDENVENPQMYEKKVINGVTRYRRISGKGIAAGLDKRQQDVISKYKAQGGKLENEVSELESKTWTKKLVSPKSDRLFSEDLYMYFPPNTITNQGITNAFNQALIDQTPKNSADCKDLIEKYYVAFKKKKVFTADIFDATKEKVQACKNQYYQDWGGVFSGGKKLDNILDIMSGVVSGGPSAYDEDSKWRLK